jgi:hypothetical protein
MVNPMDEVPAYLTIRMTALADPRAELADVQAWQARESYPAILSAGRPLFGVAREREEGGWQLCTGLEVQPQQARDTLGCLCRGIVQEALDAGDEELHRSASAAVHRLDWEKADEVEAGSRYRVVRVERFVRSGADGPEPPRSTDLDDVEHRDLSRDLDPARDFVLDPLTPTGMSEGILKTDLLQLVPAQNEFPDGMREDALRAAGTHPGLVLLPAAFTVAERVGDHWRPTGLVDVGTPFRARDLLSTTLRVSDPVELGLSPAERAVHAAAADRLEAEQPDELTVAGRFLRIVRVERMVRFGPDGPEGPRPFDPDPEDPVLLADQKLRDRGIVIDEDTPIVLSESAKEFQRLFEAEMVRRGKTPRPRADRAQEQQPAGAE